MTDRLAGVIVTFDRDIREDDAESLMSALRMFRGVADVSPIQANLQQAVAHNRARRELIDKLWDALK